MRGGGSYVNELERDMVVSTVSLVLVFSGLASLFVGSASLVLVLHVVANRSIAVCCTWTYSWCIVWVSGRGSCLSLGVKRVCVCACVWCLYYCVCFNIQVAFKVLVGSCLYIDIGYSIQGVR